MSVTMKRLWILATALSALMSTGCAGDEEYRDMAQSRADELTQSSYVLNTWAGSAAGQPIRFSQDLDLLGEDGETCRIEAGSTYHPWAQLIRTRYKTESLVLEHRARRDFEVQDFALSRGEKVEMLLELSPGNCRYRVRGEIVDTDCAEDKDLERLVGQESKSRQSFLARCADGSETWLPVDPELLAQPGVEIGEQTATGDVKELVPLYVSQGWPGERPGPAVKITKELSLLGESCLLKPGVYHPWATKTHAQYETVTAITTFKANRPGSVTVSAEVRDVEVALETDDTVEQLRLASEGWCIVRTSEAEGVARCFDGVDFLTRVEGVSLEKSFFSVDCEGSDPASIEVNATLFEIDGIERGTIISVGVVEE